MIVRIDTYHGEIDGYGYTVSAEGQVLYGDAGLTSLIHCLAGAIEGLGADARAAELAFQGVVSGTYPLRVLATRPADVAQHAVNTTEAVMQAERE